MAETVTTVEAASPVISDAAPLFSDLPDGPLRLVLSKLSLKDRFAASRTSRDLRRLSVTDPDRGTWGTLRLIFDPPLPRRQARRTWVGGQLLEEKKKPTLGISFTAPHYIYASAQDPNGEASEPYIREVPATLVILGSAITQNKASRDAVLRMALARLKGYAAVEVVFSESIGISPYSQLPEHLTAYDDWTAFVSLLADRLSSDSIPDDFPLKIVHKLPNNDEIDNPLLEMFAAPLARLGQRRISLQVLNMGEARTAKEAKAFETLGALPGLDRLGLAKLEDNQDWSCLSQLSGISSLALFAETFNADLRPALLEPLINMANLRSLELDYPPKNLTSDIASQLVGLSSLAFGINPDDVAMTHYDEAAVFASLFPSLAALTLRVESVEVPLATGATYVFLPAPGPFSALPPSLKTLQLDFKLWFFFPDLGELAFPPDFFAAVPQVESVSVRIQWGLFRRTEQGQREDFPPTGDARCRFVPGDAFTSLTSLRALHVSQAVTYDRRDEDSRRVAPSIELPPSLSTLNALASLRIEGVDVAAFDMTLAPPQLAEGLAVRREAQLFLPKNAADGPDEEDEHFVEGREIGVVCGRARRGEPGKAAGTAEK